MHTTRREFMRQVGVTLAGLLLSGCDLSANLIPPTATQEVPEARIMCYERVIEVAVTPTSPSRTSWQALRVCWLDLRDSRLQSPEETEFSRNLRQRHANALKALVASNELQVDVAANIGLIFEHATAHILRQASACCYEPTPPEYLPREDLTTRAAALTEMAGRSNIDSETLWRARVTLERDMAWLAQFQAGKQPTALENIEATPAEIEAARILVELLTGNK